VSERTVNPELFRVAAAVVDWSALARAGGYENTATRVNARGDAREESLQLRWMVAPAIGLPRQAFTVWFRRAPILIGRLPIPSATVLGVGRLDFPQLMGILQFEFNLSSPGAVVLVYSQSGALIGSASSSGQTGVVTLQLQRSGIAYVLYEASGRLLSIYGLSANALVNQVGWHSIEQVGLPVDPTVFAGSAYSTADQGRVGALVSPAEAAKRRLLDGAPPVGWPLMIGSTPAPAWAPPTVPTLISELQTGTLGDILSMLGLSSGCSNDAFITLQKTIATPVQAGGGPAAPLSQPSQATYSPLAILLLAAGSDPFNALGFGFGTAYTIAELEQLLQLPADDVAATSDFYRRVEFFGFMVTTEHILNLFGFTVPAVFADFIAAENLQFGLTPAPAGLSAAVKILNPPLVRDAPYTGTLDATWDRPTPLFPNQTVAASYALARWSASDAATLLNAKRLSGGFMPYAASLAPTDDANAPIVFEDISVTPPTGGVDLMYSVAAQDWFGIWSAWSSTGAAFPAEPLIGPAVTDATLALSESISAPYTATLSLQIAYNWTTRSPLAIDLLVTLFVPPDPNTPLPSESAPAGIQFSIGAGYAVPARLTFDVAGNPAIAGAAGATVNQNPPPSYASPQQDIRTYSITLPGFSLDFGGAREIVAFVFATGYETVNPVPVTSAARIAHVMSPAPPPTPHYDNIVWASLADPRGISRVHLKWDPQGAPPDTRFLIYTATETGLLGTAGVAPADLSRSYAERLATLRALNLAACRTTFRRIDTTPARLMNPEQEVELPRGTRVLHAFVVTALSANNIETPFPTDAANFIAVAVPYVEIPREPRIFTRLITQAGASHAEIHIESRKGVTPARFVLYRTQREGLSRDPDLMGPPLTNSDQTGWTKTAPSPTDGTWSGIFTDPTPLGTTAPWQRVWYRASAVADDHLTDGSGNPQGALGGRSPSSIAASLIVPPPTPPVLGTITVSSIDPGASTVLILLTTSAPIATTALGSHTLIVAVFDPQQPSAAAATTWRTAIALERIVPSGAPPTLGNAGDTVRLPPAGGQTPLGVWVPRPLRGNGSTADFIVSVSITDPVGRTTQLSTNVAWWV
jgi:hypothetical protein